MIIINSKKEFFKLCDALLQEDEEDINIPENAPKDIADAIKLLSGAIKSNANAKEQKQKDLKNPRA